MTSGERVRLSLRGLAVGEAAAQGGVLAQTAMRIAGSLPNRLGSDTPSEAAEAMTDPMFLACGPALGAFFAEDEAALWQAAESLARGRSNDLLSGVIAVGLAAAWAARYREHAVANERAISDDRRRFLVWIRDRLPEGMVRSGVERASQTPLESAPIDAVTHLGAGPDVAPLVAFVLWCSARHLDAFSDALLAADSLGLRPACALAGGIVALSAGEASIPAPSLAAVPPLPPEVVAIP